jgi:hypothetical protein
LGTTNERIACPRDVLVALLKQDSTYPNETQSHHRFPQDRMTWEEYVNANSRSEREHN